MITDYERIGEENRKKYGTETAHLDFLHRLYAQRTHFLYELLQNAEDAGASRVAFELYADRLEFWHDGRVFDEQDVRGVCGVCVGTKAGTSGRSASSASASSPSTAIPVPEIHSGRRASQHRSLHPATSASTRGWTSRTLDDAPGLPLRRPKIKPERA